MDAAESLALGQAPTAVLGENESESRGSAPGGYSPARENSMRSELDSRLTVPTDEREEGAERLPRATAGGRPEISPTAGAPTWWIRRRA